MGCGRRLIRAIYAGVDRGLDAGVGRRTECWGGKIVDESKSTGASGRFCGATREPFWRRRFMPGADATAGDCVSRTRASEARFDGSREKASPYAEGNDSRHARR